MDDFEVVCASGTLGAELERSAGSTHFPHRWTPGGVRVSASFTGAHLLHAAVAGCVLNDLYREAAGLGLELAGVRVSAAGAFDENWSTTGITYRVELDSPAPPAELRRLLAIVDEVAEIPRAIRAGGAVRRAEQP